MFVVSSRHQKRYVQHLCHVVGVLLSLAVLPIAYTGCSKRYNELPAFSAIPMRDYANHSVGRFKSTYIVDQIDSYYRGVEPGPIGVTTLVNIDDLYTSSTFGRMYSEQIMSELAMRGYDVIELRHSDAVQFMSSGGEFALSRQTEAVRDMRELGGIVVGTYVVSPVRILSAGSVEMKKTGEIARLLKRGGTSATLERVPVRHLGINSSPLFGGMQNRFGYDVEEIEMDSFKKGAVLPKIGPATSPASGAK
jgi:FlgO protein